MHFGVRREVQLVSDLVDLSSNLERPKEPEHAKVPRKGRPTRAPQNPNAPRTDIPREHRILKQFSVHILLNPLIFFYQIEISNTAES